MIHTLCMLEHVIILLYHRNVALSGSPDKRYILRPPEQSSILQGGGHDNAKTIPVTTAIYLSFRNR